MHKCITCSKFSKRQCTLYSNSRSASMGSTKPFTSYTTRQQLPNRPSTPSGCKLDEGDIRSLGFKHHSRLQDRILGSTQTEPSSQAPSTLPEGDSTNEDRDSQLLVKQAISVVSSPYNQSFLSRIFLVPKKEFSKASNKLMSVKPVHNLGTL